MSSPTETCFCGAVQLSFSLEGDNLVNSFVCNCTDCRKLTASTFASNFTIRDTTLKYVRGEDKITKYGQNKTIATGNTMTNYFCSVCGSLMYRISSGWPGVVIMRIGQVDQYDLVETVLRPTLETFVKDRVGWLPGAVGAKQHHGNYFGELSAEKEEKDKGKI